VFVDIECIRDQFPFDPFKAIVAPRPIGWISTISASGIPNLAPYSFLMRSVVILTSLVLVALAGKIQSRIATPLANSCLTL
jgi:flavin reductase (DIM6/NTAB) family NADH-FMN oxidoreductase RutF